MNRQKRTQELFREVNERIHCIVGPEAREAGEHVEYLCECGSLDCMETVKLATYQYEAVRACAGLLVLAPAHQHEATGRVLAHGLAYALLESVPNESADRPQPPSARGADHVYPQ